MKKANKLKLFIVTFCTFLLVFAAICICFSGLKNSYTIKERDLSLVKRENLITAKQNNFIINDKTSSQISQEVPTEAVAIEKAELTADCNEEVRPGDIINLKIELTPVYAIETVQSIEYLIIRGNEHIQQDKNVIIIKKNAEIGGIVEVKVCINGTYSNTLIFSIIETPIERISILNEEDSIEQNGTLILQTELYPQDASNQNLHYSIVEGASYANINLDGVITAKNNLPRGNIQIKVRVQSVANSQVYAEKIFKLYVPTRTLLLTASNNSPALGESIMLKAIADSTASDCQANFIVREQDMKYVKSIEGDTITIADDIIDFNPSITVYYTRDGITEELTLNVYIPATSLSINVPTDTIKQGGMTKLSVNVTPANATLKNLMFSLNSTDCASITKDGLITAFVSPNVDNTTVEIIAKLDNLIANAVINIVRPNVILIADNYNPETSSTYSQTVKLNTEVDGVLQLENISYNIKSGEDYIVDGKIGQDGTFTIVHNIKDFSPEIILSVTYGSWESNEIIIRPRIMIESISVKNSNISLVETQKGYIFEGICYPINAEGIKEGLTYSIDVSSEIATISSEGELFVSNTAPVGTQINITISSNDGITASHSVTVKTVYATELRLDKVLNQDGLEISNGGTVNAGDTLTFEASFPQPYNVSEIQKVYTVEFHSGNDIATYNSHDVTIKPQSEIKENNPTITFKIVSMQNNEVLVQYFTVYVHISVVSIDYIQKLEYVDEGAVIAINELVDASAKPDNSSIRDIAYNVSGYAHIEGEYIVVDDNVPTGSATFVLNLSAENVSISLTYLIYAHTLEINLQTDNANPVSTKNGGETVTITVNKDNASTDELRLSIVSGAELIVGNYENNDILPLTFDENGLATFIFTVKPSAQIYADKLIKFIAVQGLVTKKVEIIVYKPIEDFEISTSKTIGNTQYVQRGVANSLNVNYTPYASESNKWTVDCQFIDISNRSNPKMNVPLSAQAGTVYIVTVNTNDRLNKSFVFEFTVDKLDANLLAFANKGNNSSTNPYTCDSNGVAISSKTPQLYVGRYTDVVVTYKGFDLEDYGLKIDSSNGVGFVDGGDWATISRLSYNTARISINSNASGKLSVQPQIIVQDGTESYTITLKPIAVFRPMSGTPILTNKAIMSSPTQLKLDCGDFDMTATYGLDSLIFKGVSLSGVSITEKGLLTVESDSAAATQTIKLSTIKSDGTSIQIYNDTYVDYSVTVTQAINRLILSHNGGVSSMKDICAVDDLGNSVVVPQKTGYIFCGYFAYYHGLEIEYYDKNGNLSVKHSDDKSSGVIFAKWQPISYKVEFYVQKSDGQVAAYFIDGSNGKEGQYCIYDKEYVIKEMQGLAGTFSHWEINGVTYINGNQPINEVKQRYKNLTTIDNEIVRFVAIVDWNCIASGSMITLANGTNKAVEDLDGTEHLLVWNLRTGQFDSAPLVFVDRHGLKTYEIVRLTFSDGAKVDVIDDHGFFDIDLQKYVFISKNTSQYIGDWFVTQEGKAQLLSIETFVKQTGSFSPITFGDLCYFVNGMLSMPANTQSFINIFDVDVESMRIDTEQYQKEILEYGLYTYDSFITDFNSYLNSCNRNLSLEATYAMLPEAMFEAFNGQYLEISLCKKNTSWEELTVLIETYSEKLTGGSV